MVDEQIAISATRRTFSTHQTLNLKDNGDVLIQIGGIRLTEEMWERLKVAVDESIKSAKQW